MRKATAGLAAIGLLAAPTAAADQPDPVDTAIHQLVAGGFPGAVAYTRDGTRISHFSAGVADTATGEPARDDQRFRIASNTKAFVATVLLQLAGEGRLSLDETVEHRLPGVVRGPGYDANRITVRQLLTHTSGIHDPRDPHFFDPYLVDHDWGHVYTPDEVIRRSLVDPPAPGMEYSNTGYLLLGKIIERASGDVVREIHRRILAPLGLSDTSFPLTDPHLHGPHLHGYDLAGQDMSVFSPSYDWTAGAMVSTVDDLAKFHRALFAGELLAPEQQRELRNVVPQNENQAYGAGVERWDLGCAGGVVWGNSGAGPGYYSLSFTSDDGTRQAVITLTEYDLGADVRGEQPWPTNPLPALSAAFCK